VPLTAVVTAANVNDTTMFQALLEEIPPIRTPAGRRRTRPGLVAMADPVPAAPFELLHPAVQHHVVNSLGWRTLRPLQTATIQPILAGDHLIATAPTAGGKTEAAVLPLLPRMLSEDWRGLSVLYVCPLRALLNDLHQRLERYMQLVGRRVGRWHGDIGQPERDRLLAEPPDLLLTTPESLEAMLVSPRVPHERWFADVRAVVVDEVHAFAGDDRGWHLLAVLERITRLAGREVQRIALSATLGNPASLLAWLTPTCRGPARVVNPPAQTGPAKVTLDHVGSLANAALVVSRLHRGEKRLVFVDSRARTEQLAVALHGHDVTTLACRRSACTTSDTATRPRPWPPACCAGHPPRPAARRPTAAPCRAGW
jgi:ATP-dependent helicase Lhr and Lhr-like helicase